MPLAGSRDSVPCGVWGNAPTVPRATSMPNALNKGAGSEASLPVTSRSLRSAPKLLFPTSVLCRAGWARPNSWSCDHSCSFPKAGDFAPAGASPTAKAVRIFAGRGCGRLFSYTNSHLKHGIRTASFPPRLCFVPLARISDWSVCAISPTGCPARSISKIRSTMAASSGTISGLPSSPFR